jgi:hypothetical protein
LQDATVYLRAAAIFLKDRCRVYGPATLPYSFQIVLLAEAIRRGTKDLTTEDLASKLERWFWLTTYTEYFASMSSTRLRKALEHLREVAEGKADVDPPDLVRTVHAIERFDFRAARSRAMALRMAELEPKTADGEVQGPFRLLAEHGRNAMPMLFPSREIEQHDLAERVENRILVGPKGFVQLRRLLRDEAEHGDPEIFRSHAIEPEAARELARGDRVEFLRLRRQRLIEIERSFVENLGLKYVIE